jgi:hypothetical protein
MRAALLDSRVAIRQATRRLIHAGAERFVVAVEGSEPLWGRAVQFSDV